MKLLPKTLGVVVLLLLLLLALAVLVPTPLQVASELAFGWARFLGRVVPKTQVNPAAVGFFLAVTALVVGGTHWLARSLWDPQGSRWPWRWSFGLYASIWLLFLTSMGVTGVAHQAGWLWRSHEPWARERHEGWRSRMDMRAIARMIEISGREHTGGRDPDVSDIRAEVIKEVSSWLESCSFQLFPPDAGPFRAAIVRPRSQEVLDRYGFILVRRLGRIAKPTDLKSGGEPAPREITAGREYKPVSDLPDPAGTDR